MQTWEFEDEPGHPTLEVFTFVDLSEGRSRIDGLTVFLSIEDRDASMLGGFDSGRDEDFERLDQLLAGTTVAGWIASPMYTTHQVAYTPSMKRLQIYIDEETDEELARRALQRGTSKAALIREVVRREYHAGRVKDPFDDWAGGIDEAPGDIDALIYDR